MLEYLTVTQTVANLSDWHDSSICSGGFQGQKWDSLGPATVTTNTYDQFREDLYDALTHLHSPDFQPSELLCGVIGQGAQDAGAFVQSEIVQTITDLAGIFLPSPLSPYAR